MQGAHRRPLHLLPRMPSAAPVAVAPAQRAPSAVVAPPPPLSGSCLGSTASDCSRAHRPSSGLHSTGASTGSSRASTEQKPAGTKWDWYIMKLVLCCLSYTPDAGPSSPADHLREIFYGMGLDDKEIVALSGAGTLGRSKSERSGRGLT